MIGAFRDHAHDAAFGPAAARRDQHRYDKRDQSSRGQHRLILTRLRASALLERDAVDRGGTGIRSAPDTMIEANA
jgi:hypothetical protein